MDTENELARGKWFLAGLLIFLLSGCLSYRELDYLMNGRETQADITKVYESRGRRGSKRLTVEYAFTEQNGKQRRAMDTVLIDWHVPPNGKVMVQYTPGEDGSSRLTGGVHWVWPAVFAVSICILGVIAIRLLLEGAKEPKPRRRRRKSWRLLSTTPHKYGNSGKRTPHQCRSGYFSHDFGRFFTTAGLPADRQRGREMIASVCAASRANNSSSLGQGSCVEILRVGCREVLFFRAVSLLSRQPRPRISTQLGRGLVRLPFDPANRTRSEVSCIGLALKLAPDIMTSSPPPPPHPIITMRMFLTLACALLATNSIFAATPVDFARDVRPIFSSQCYQCHGPDEKARKAKLRLDVRDDAIKSGSLVPGQPEKSELFKRICSTDPDERMPPEKSKKPALTAAQIATLKQWIAEGAKYSEHWSFVTLTRPAAPEIKTPKFEIHNPIDAFILSRLESEGVNPAKEADRITLIRRLYFDLTGLPPSPEDVRAFVNDKDPKAYEKLVDKLLASPHYGERMAVWWLDLVRYADTIGYHSDNPMSVYAYRDYVIRAFNTNMPFDQFTTEQLAGDLLPKPTGWQRVASAYNRLLQTTEEGGAQAKEYEAKYAADRVRNYGQVWLGGTLMCSECHNHKFDPYTQADFYSMAAFFADIQEPAVGGRGPGTPIPLTSEQEVALHRITRNVAIAQAKLDTAAKVFAEAEDAFADVASWPHPTTKGPTKVVIPPDVKAILAKAADKRAPAEIARLATFARDNAPDLKADRDAIAAANAAKTAYENSIPRVLITISGASRTVRILPRGNWLDNSGPIMTPKTPGFLPPLPPLPKGQTRYTRLDLARWTVSPDNPLTARVAVNRLWRLFFGYGIARSLEESGVQGQLPTHPELLNWLASEFKTKWDIKQIVRLMVLSSTYRQSSVETPEIRERDPMNKLFARQTRQRLDAEFIRDSALSVSGLLNPKIGGPSVKPYQPPGYWAALNFPPREWQKDTGEKVYRRGMYTHWQRSFPHPAMVAFDAPSREECTCDRTKSNIPQQALVLLNDPEFVEAAKAFAAKTLADGGASDDAKVKWAFESATARLPKPEEVQILLALLKKHRAHFASNPADAKKLLSVGDVSVPKDMKPDELAAWVSVCRTMLNLHETITRQ